MENLRNGEESDSSWIPYTLFRESSITIPVLKFFGLERYSSSSSFSSSSSSGSLSSSSEDEGMVIREEEEVDMIVETRGKAKDNNPPPETSPGKPDINNPFKEDESAQSTVVQIMFPSYPPIVCEYDWATDALEEFTDDLIKETLLMDQKDEFIEFVKEQIDETKLRQLMKSLRL